MSDNNKVKNKIVLFYYPAQSKGSRTYNFSKVWRVIRATRLSALLTTTILVASSSVYAGDNTLPTGGVVTAGSATISSSANVMNVDQSTQRAAINWQGFSIGESATVNFNQPDASSITLNRVVGNEQSVINGALNANGQVFLLNSQGILFGKGSSVNVGGIVASTLDLSDKDFMASKSTFASKNGKGSVINLGKINAADGGYAALLGNEVINDGVITAQAGSAIMASGDKISLNFNGNSLVGVTIDKGTLGAMVKNKQAIIADGGKVILTAKGLDKSLAGVVNNSGEIRARTISKNKKGEIYLLGGMEHDSVEVGGKLDASATGAGNDGGFIESSAAKVRVAASAKITTKSAQGKTGTYLIDPTNFTISSGSGAQTGSGMGADTLSATLNGTNFIIQTQAAGTEAGDINVDANVMWEQNKLTLEAHGDINVNAVMSPVGTSTLDMKTGYNFNVESPTYDATKMVRMKIDTSTPKTPVFVGKIDFNGRTGTGALAINGDDYRLINALGSAGDESAAGNYNLQGMAHASNSSEKFALSSDINALDTLGWNAGVGFMSIGENSSPFSGKFNGLGHTITGLHINRSASSNVGLFGEVSNPVISNVGLIGGSISGADNVGAIVGMGSLIINNAYSTADVTGASSVGGLIGHADTLTASNSYAIGNVTGLTYYLGGLVGNVNGKATITNSYATGNVKGTEGYQDVHAYVGGLAGSITDAEIKNSYATGDVTSNDAYVGGLVGYVGGGTIEQSYATGYVYGDNNVGGLVGWLSNSTINGSYSTGMVDAYDNVGGLVGWLSNSTINGSYSTGIVNAVSNVGGLVGYSEASTISKSYVISPLVSGGGNYIGGFAGNVDSSSTIANSFARSSVIGGDVIGGFVGRINNSSIINSYSAGAVITTDGNAIYLGGFIGKSDGSNTITNSYWDLQTSGQTTSAGGVGKTTAEMKGSAPYTEGGWDFGTPVSGSQYPTLRWVDGSPIWMAYDGSGQSGLPPDIAALIADIIKAEIQKIIASLPSNYVVISYVITGDYLPGNASSSSSSNASSSSSSNASEPPPNKVDTGGSNQVKKSAKKGSMNARKVSMAGGRNKSLGNLEIVDGGLKLPLGLDQILTEEKEGK